MEKPTWELELLGFEKKYSSDGENAVPEERILERLTEERVSPISSLPLIEKERVAPKEYALLL